MTELWPTYTQEGSLGTGFHSTSHAEVEELAFLDYGTITQEQITDMNDSALFATMDVSTSSDLSEEEIQESCSDFKQLDTEVKALKET